MTRANVTSLLIRAQQGDRLATDELFPLVYEELRRVAEQFLSRENAAHTLQPTALVHEAYIRLVGPADITWESRRHFFGSAARAIRRILTDHARSKRRAKRGGGAQRIPVDEAAVVIQGIDLDILALDDALKLLAQLDPHKADLVELRFFAGLSMEDIAHALGASPSTIARDWRFARAWLHRELTGEQTS